MRTSKEENLITETLCKIGNISILIRYKNLDEKHQIESDIHDILYYVIEDITKITPYIDVDTEVNILLGYRHHGPLAMTTVNKSGLVSQKVNCFNVDIDSKYLTVQNHEFGHVIDKV